MGNIFKSVTVMLCICVWLAQLGSGIVLKLPPQTEECVMFRLHEGNMVLGSYSVLPETVRYFSVVVRDKRVNTVVYSSARNRQGRWQHQLKPAHSGSHEEKQRGESPRMFSYCMRNSENFDASVDFSIRTDEHLALAVATDDKTTSLMHRVNQMQSVLHNLVDQQRYALREEEMHRDTVEATNRLVFRWMVVKVLTVLILAGLQNYYFRSYFEVKTTV